MNKFRKGLLACSLVFGFGQASFAQEIQPPPASEQAVAINIQTTPQAVAPRVTSNRDTDGYFQWRNVGVRNLRIYQNGQYLRHNQVLALRQIGATEAEVNEVVTALMNKSAEEGQMTRGMKFSKMTFSTKAGVRAMGKVMYVGDETHRIWRIRTSSGRVFTIVEKCDNVALEEAPPPPPQVTYTPPPPVAETPPPVAMEPVMEEREVEVVEKSTAELEWEAIMGAWVGRSGLANFRGAYAEATLYVPLGDGWKAGLGFRGMVGAGESRVSPYSWREHRYGPQFALRHDYMKCRERTYGEIKQEECLPAGDGLKVGYLWDSVSGGNPVSGYHQTQRGHGINIYAEHVERTNDDFLWGVTGEAFLYGGGRINSTWSGDRPQNRSFYSVNAFGQWRLDDNWQVRAGLGLSHQAWDKVNYLSIFAEARWQETVMCGPRFSLALNRPETYRPYGSSALNTLMGFCRIELGGKMRAWDMERRRKRVQLVQVGVREVPVTEPLMVERREPLPRAPTLDITQEQLPEVRLPVVAKPQIINLNE